jgi:hypothetical protein
MTRRQRTGNRFLDMGVGVLGFVWEWPRLYAALFLAPPDGYDPGVDLMAELTSTMAALPELEPLPLSERIVVLKKLAIFTHGLATEICQGCAEHCSLDTLVVLLSEVGRAVVADARAGHPRSDADTALLAGFRVETAAPHPNREDAEE